MSSGAGHRVRNRWGLAMQSIQTFSKVRSLDVTWLPDFERPGSEILTTCAQKMY